MNGKDLIKSLTVILVDNKDNIIDTITDGVEDGIIVVTHTVMDFIKAAAELIIKK